MIKLYYVENMEIEEEIVQMTLYSAYYITKMSNIDYEKETQGDRIESFKM